MIIAHIGMLLAHIGILIARIAPTDSCSTRTYAQFLRAARACLQLGARAVGPVASVGVAGPHPPMVPPRMMPVLQRRVDRLTNNHPAAAVDAVISASHRRIDHARHRTLLNDHVNRSRLRPIFRNILPVNVALFAFVTLQRNSCFSGKHRGRQTGACEEDGCEERRSVHLVSRFVFWTHLGRR